MTLRRTAIAVSCRPTGSVCCRATRRDDKVRVAAVGQLPRRPAAVLGHDINLVLVAGVGDVGDPAAVGRPDRVPLVDAGGVCEIAGIAVPGGNGEDVAAGDEHRAIAVGRDVIIGHLAADLAQAAAAPGHVLVQHHVDLLDAAGRHLVAIEETAVLEHDARIAERGELDVEVLVVRDLPRGFRLQVVGEQVHALVRVAVGEEINGIAVPHGHDVAGRVVGDVRDGLLLEVIDPQVVGLAAAVALPGAKLAEDAVIHQLLLVGRVGTPAAARQRKLFGQAAVDRHGIQLADEVDPRVGSRADDDRLVVAPRHHQIVRAIPIGNVVVFEAAGKGNPPRNTAFGRHHVDLGAAVVLAGERQPAAVGRETGEHFIADVTGEFSRHAAPRGDRVQVAGIGKDNPVAMDRREAEQAGLVVGVRHGGTGDGQRQAGGNDPGKSGLWSWKGHGRKSLANRGRNIRRHTRRVGPDRVASAGPPSFIGKHITVGLPSLRDLVYDTCLTGSKRAAASAISAVRRRSTYDIMNARELPFFVEKNMPHKAPGPYCAGRPCARIDLPASTPVGQISSFGRMNVEKLCLAIDIGAGLGVKMGLFTDPHRQIEDELLRRDECAG